MANDHHNSFPPDRWGREDTILVLLSVGVISLAIIVAAILATT